MKNVQNDAAALGTTKRTVCLGTPIKKSPAQNEKGKTNDERDDTGSNPMTFSQLVRELEKKE